MYQSMRCGEWKTHLCGDKSKVVEVGCGVGLMWGEGKVKVRLDRGRIWGCRYGVILVDKGENLGRRVRNVIEIVR